MIIFLFNQQFCTKIDNKLVQDNTDHVVDEKAEDLEDSGVATNELLEEVGQCEDNVLNNIERDLKSTINISAESMDINSEIHKT